MRTFLFTGMLLVLSAFAITGCETLKSLPTNTTSGIFSLNGTWRLVSTSDNSALVGSTVTVYPLVGDGVVKSLNNNTYCIRENDQLWKSVKSNGSGGFAISTLVNACSGSKVYNVGTIAVTNNDNITVSSRAGNVDLIQSWERVKQPQ